jgi:AcrR family transcriptional regulator
LVRHEPDEVERVDGEPPTGSPGDELPGWQRRSVERSLESARVRARQRSDRFVNAALDFILEEGSVDFTIQDVVDRSGMSVRTFYSFFDGKDSLLLAIYETILRKTAVPILREECDKETEPVLRLRALLAGLTERTATTNPTYRALSVFHLRLAETRPRDLAHALNPLRGLIVELLGEVEAAGLLRADLDISAQAGLLLELLLANAHTSILSGIRRASPEDMWAFCSAAVLRTTS